MGRSSESSAPTKPRPGVSRSAPALLFGGDTDGIKGTGRLMPQSACSA